MALTSVVPTYPHQQQANELANGTVGLQPFSTYTTVGIPQSSQMNFANSPEAPTNILISPATTPHASFYQSASLPNAYFATPTTNNGSESFRFVQPSLHAMLNTYPAFRASPYSTALPNGTTPRTCLLPTPGPLSVSANANSFGHAENGVTSKQPVISDSQCESIAMSEDQTFLKHGVAQSDNACPQQNTIILIVRLLMSGKEVGSIIGKRGENVKKYREESGARINISDGSSPERIVTVTGTTDQIFVAFSLMSQKFEDDFTQGLLRMGDEGLTCPPVTLRLLVPATQCGSIIGKGGSRIKDVRELTGASIQVASEALPTSTERTVTISGTAKAIAKCIRQLCDIFIESPARGPVIPYRPKPAFVNHSVVCPPSPYSADVIHPSLTFPGMLSDNNHEHFSTSTSVHNVAINSPVHITTEASTRVPSSMGQPLLGSFNIQHPKFITMDGNINTAFGTPVDSNMLSGAIHSTRTGSMFGELLDDPAQLSTALNFSDLSANPMSLLNALHSGSLTAGTMPSPIINPLSTAFAIPDLALDPRGLFGFYSPHPIAGIGSGNNYFITGPQNSVKSTYVYGGSSGGSIGGAGGGSDETASVSQNNDGAGEDTPDTRLQTTGAFLSDVHASNPLLSLMQAQNSYLHSTGLLNPISNSSVPVLPNKSSILGLPAFSMQPAIISSTTALRACPDDSNTVIKEILLSNDLIGCIIGRGGTTVNEIRNISKAQVKISNCEDGAKDRKITLSGSPNAVNLAHFLINNSIVAHQQIWAFNIQLASAATMLMSRTCNTSEYYSVSSNWNSRSPSNSFDGASVEAMITTKDGSLMPTHSSKSDCDLSPSNVAESTTVSSRSMLDMDLNVARTDQKLFRTKLFNHRSYGYRQQQRSKVAPY